MDVADVIAKVERMPDAGSREELVFAWRADALAHVLKTHGVPDGIAERVANEIGAELGWNTRVAGTRLGRFTVPDEDATVGPILAQLVTPQAPGFLIEQVPAAAWAAKPITAAVAVGIIVYKAVRRGALLTPDEARVLTALNCAHRQSSIPRASAGEIVVWLRTLFGIRTKEHDVDAILTSLLARECGDKQSRPFVRKHDGSPLRWSSLVT